MNANVYFTQADAERNYLNTRMALRTYSDSELAKEYHENLRDTFNPMFGRNATKFFNLVCDELLRRGITELPNIFGPIKVTRKEVL